MDGVRGDRNNSIGDGGSGHEGWPLWGGAEGEGGGVCGGPLRKPSQIPIVTGFPVSRVYRSRDFFVKNEACRCFSRDQQFCPAQPGADEGRGESQ